MKHSYGNPIWITIKKMNSVGIQMGFP
jgi:hypothetical protein